MAGAGYKLFNTGDVLTAAQVNTYLQEQAVMRFANAVARTTALSGVLAEGMVSYLMDTNAVEVYDGSAWVGVATGDITAVTAGTGISGGGTSGAVTITNSMATEITAAGDIIVGTGSGTFDNLPIGTTGQVLTADTSVSPYKVKWAAAAGGSSFAGVRVYNTSAQTISNATWTNITWGLESFDTDGFHSTSSNTERLTAPTGKAGYYWVWGTCRFASNSTGRRIARIGKNNSTTVWNASEIQPPSSASALAYPATGAIVYLNVGDYVNFQVYQSSGGNLDTVADDEAPNFMMYYLGA